MQLMGRRCISQEVEYVHQKLADYAHGAWSGWMKYMFEKLIPYRPGTVQAEEGALIIPKWAVDRWTYQMNMTYNDLPESMKESDRQEADKIIAIISIPSNRGNHSDQG